MRTISYVYERFFVVKGWIHLMMGKSPNEIEFLIGQSPINGNIDYKYDKLNAINLPFGDGTTCLKTHSFGDAESDIRLRGFTQISDQ